MTFDVIIFGAGQIAANFDSPSSPDFLTHAHAITSHDCFNLLGFYDIDFPKAKSAAEKWNVGAFNVPISADVAVICTPDSVHLQSIRESLELSPKLIVLEKPISDSLATAEEIESLTKGIPVQVNFTRRFIGEFEELSKQIRNRRSFGQFLGGTGLYGKGFIHNGSHMLDLLRLLVGEIKSVKTISEIFDHVRNDATKTAIIDFENGSQFFMRGLDSRLYTVFELELCFEKGRVKISDGGARIQYEETKPSDKYSGYTNLYLKEEVFPETGRAMFNLYNNVRDFLTGESELLSPLETAFTAAVYS
ncbi:MAG: Gfo/Idh/MocA family oxidoreductase [Oscillospiraceae bacterium]|nr:Gfo/Idh/MocA family oxidoreductase [Oscillospiraceae bacterium]